MNQLEEARKKFALESLLKKLDRLDLLIVDELGYLSFSRSVPSCSSRCSRTATSVAAC